MRKEFKHFKTILFSLFLLLSCKNGGQNYDMNDSISFETKNNILLFDTIKNEGTAQKPSYDYNDVLNAQKSLVQEFSWPVKHELDLNNDKVNEVFLAIEGYSRGMGYVLFTRQNQNWKLISGDESIASGHLGISRLDKVNDGWHDFVAIQPSGRDGIIESYYTWNGQKYILLEQKEVEN